MPRRLAALLLGLAVLLPAAPAAAETAPRPGPDGLTTGRVVVRYRPGTTLLARRKAARLSGGKAAVRLPKLDAEVLDTRDPALTAARLSGRREVLWAQPEVLAQRYAQVAQPERSELDYAGAVAADPLMKGTNVKVAVIDDGVWGVSDLSGRLVDRGNCSTGACAATGAVNAGAGSHGTAVATVIAAANDSVGIVGGAPEARIWAYRVFPDEVSGASDSAIAAAIVKAADDNVAVANLSLGTPFDSYLLRAAVSYARATRPNMVIVAAAGNDGTERASYPAGSPTVLSVGASEQNGASWPVASFSTRGDVDVLAPGVNVRAWYTDADAAPPVPSGNCTSGDNLSCVHGTSFAAPEVAAILAGLAGTGVTGDRARAAVVASAETRASSSYPDAASGAGRADALKARNLAKGTAAYTAAFVDRGAYVATTVGRRRVEVLRVDPQPGTAPDGPATLTAAEGTVSLVSSSSATVGTVAVHRSHYDYSAPIGGSVPRSSSLSASAAGDTGAAVRTVPLELLRSTAGPEGTPIGAGLPLTTTTLTYGSQSGYIRTAALSRGQKLTITFAYPMTSSESLLFVWLPNTLTGGMRASEMPFLSDVSGEFTGTLSYVAPVSGVYAFGFLLFTEGDDGSYKLSATISGDGLDLRAPTGTTGRPTSDLRPTT